MQWIDVTRDIVFLCFRFRLFTTIDVVIMFVHMLCGMFVSTTTEGMVCSRSWSGGTHPIMLSSSDNPGPNQRQVVYVLQYPGSHTGFPQEGSVSTHV
jgi:hypothetical protein